MIFNANATILVGIIQCWDDTLIISVGGWLLNRLVWGCLPHREGFYNQALTLNIPAHRGLVNWFPIADKKEGFSREQRALGSFVHAEESIPLSFLPFSAETGAEGRREEERGERREERGERREELGESPWRRSVCRVMECDLLVSWWRGSSGARCDWGARQRFSQ